jgi:hypothetical protein
MVDTATVHIRVIFAQPVGYPRFDGELIPLRFCYVLAPEHPFGKRWKSIRKTLESAA